MSLTDRVQQITHEGRQIIISDFTGLSGDDLLVVLDESRRYVGKAAPGVLTISNFENSKFNIKFQTEAKAFGKDFDHKMKKNALLGYQDYRKYSTTATIE